ncbi:hypothetical protein LXA43DRAFT_1159986, partial [Ganoderma leucocontextum]
MILPDNTPESPTKSRAGPLSAISEETHEDHISPPPAYPGHPHTSYQYQNVDIEAQAGSSQTPVVQWPGSPPAHYVEEFEPAPKRFLKAFGVALLIYIVVASFTRTAVAGVHWESGGRHVQVSIMLIPFPRPSDGKIISCSSASNAHLVRVGMSSVPVTTFHLPLSADLLYIWGRGALSHGTINFVPTTDRSIPEGSVRVDITPREASTIALQSANICLLESAGNQRSIAILTPKIWWPTSDLTLTVDVQFPVPARNSPPLRVKAFETKLPLFKHVFSKLEGKVTFGSLKVYSANKPIHGDVRLHAQCHVLDLERPDPSVQYVDAENATIITSNARIDGKFHVSRLLDLQTSNQPIDAEVILDHDAPTQGDAPTNLTLHTANALIRSKISLRTTSPSRLGGSFAVSASTQNGAVDLSFPAQPADSTLTLSASTSNSPATVRLHPAYEGRFEIGTVNGPVAFAPDEHAQDPARRGRSRVWVLTERTMKVWRGMVSWGRPNDPGRDRGGSVSVETLNGAVELR